MPSDYHPWETEGISEAAYWKRAYLEARKEVGESSCSACGKDIHGGTYRSTYCYNCNPPGHGKRNLEWFKARVEELEKENANLKSVIRGKTFPLDDTQRLIKSTEKASFLEGWCREVCEWKGWALPAILGKEDKDVE